MEPAAREVTVTWSVPIDIAARIAPAAASTGITQREWVRRAVESWVSDVDTVAAAAVGETVGAVLPREIAQAVTLNRAAGNRDVVSTWTAFMVMARWPADVLATSLGVDPAQVRSDAAAGRALLSSHCDMKDVSRRLPAVLDPPDEVAAPPEPAGVETKAVKAWVSEHVKAQYQRKRALLGWSTPQTGCVLLLEALADS